MGVQVLTAIRNIFLNQKSIQKDITNQSQDLSSHDARCACFCQNIYYLYTAVISYDLSGEVGAVIDDGVNEFGDFFGSSVTGH